MPKYSTKINATGSDGNIFNLLGATRKLMLKLGEPQEVITAVIKRVMDSATYEAACDIIEEYFPLIKEEDLK